MISHRPFKGAQYAAQVPDRKALGGFRVLGYTETPTEADSLIQTHRQNKGRRATEGARTVTLAELNGNR